MTVEEKKRHYDKDKKRHHDAAKKHHNIINPVTLRGVVTESELRSLIMTRGHSEWSTRVRVCGLLLLIDYIVRRLKNRAISISAELARAFVSKLKKGAIREPLPLLCSVGILQQVRPGVCAHVRASAVYRLGDQFQKVLELRVALPPKLLSKRENAEQRCQNGLNRKYRYREQLLKDLNAISFASAARDPIAKMLDGNGRDNVRRLVTAIDGREHNVWTSERGQITTTIGNCPKELQSYLLLHQERTLFCDIAQAQWNFLPLILSNRVRHVAGLPDRQKYVADGWREHDKLTLILSDGDFYRRWCVDPGSDTERANKKQLLNMLLHKKNEQCCANRLYLRLKAEFPITVAVIENIKRTDHRNLSKQLHRFIGDTVAAALLEVQQKGIAAIPFVDALMCQQTNQAVVCEALGRQIFLAAGVCAKVGGIRYSPLTEKEEAALAFDEEVASNDGMSYDEWEAIRIVKCVAALKLMRRCPPLFVPVALATCSKANIRRKELI
jgi:hypothetical protein